MDVDGHALTVHVELEGFVEVDVGIRLEHDFGAEKERTVGQSVRSDSNWRPMGAQVPAAASSSHVGRDRHKRFGHIGALPGVMSMNANDRRMTRCSSCW